MGNTTNVIYGKWSSYYVSHTTFKIKRGKLPYSLKLYKVNQINKITRQYRWAERACALSRALRSYYCKLTNHWLGGSSRDALLVYRCRSFELPHWFILKLLGTWAWLINTLWYYLNNISLKTHLVVLMWLNFKTCYFLYVEIQYKIRNTRVFFLSYTIWTSQ